MHTGEHDDVGIDGHRLARQSEAIAHDVGDTVKDLRRLVVVRQDHRVPLALQSEDGVDVVGEHRPLDGRDDGFNPLIERCGAFQCGCHGHGLVLRVMLYMSISWAYARPEYKIDKRILASRYGTGRIAPLPAQKW